MINGICVNNCHCGGIAQIIQGTTPTLTLNLNMDFSEGYELRLAVKTGLRTMFIVGSENLSIAPSKCGCTVSTSFTQEQTLAMKKDILIQLTAKQIDTGIVLKTDQIHIVIAGSLDKEVM